DSLSVTANSLDSIKNNLYKNGLEITEKSTKGIGETISSVLSTLKIPKENVKSFVYASPEIQAECFSAGQDECVLRFSSALINLLTLDELKFVIGHELGHFLFRHKGISN